MRHLVPIAAILSTLAAACGNGPHPPDRPNRPAPVDSVSARGPTRVEMAGVDLRVLENAVVRVDRLEGTVEALGSDGPVPLDDPVGFRIRVSGGRVKVGWNDLSRVLNGYTFDFPGAPVSHLEAAREDDADERDRIELKGRLKGSLIGLPFEIEGVPEVTTDGRIRIRTASIQALHIGVGGLLHVLGLDTEDLIGHLEDRGLTTDGDDLLLEPGRAFPPPRVEGRVTAVTVEDDGMLLSFDPPGHETKKPPRGGHYIWFRGGTIRIGKMTQRDADLRLVDRDGSDPFDFYSERMNRQLVAGYARLRADGGLTMFLPDYGDIGSHHEGGDDHVE